jgi:hypothetical protein
VWWSMRPGRCVRGRVDGGGSGSGLVEVSGLGFLDQRWTEDMGWGLGLGGDLVGCRCNFSIGWISTVEMFLCLAIRG